MKISIIGTGYVGLVTGVCLAEKGHQTICIDIDKEKIDRIRRGKSPFFERGLDDLLEKNLGVRFAATTDLGKAILETDVTMIAVGTPFDGQSIDLSFIREVSKNIGTVLRDKPSYHLVVVKSTVVPGTTDEVVLPLLEQYSGKKAGTDFGVGMNPEFLTEGEAIDDFMFPDRIILGGNDEKSIGVLGGIYAGFDNNVERVRTNNKTAELIKYASNALLAVAISFSNEIGNLCAALGGVDVLDVMHGVHLSKYLTVSLPEGGKISPAIQSFLAAGCGFGGSCLPKDVKALIVHGENAGEPMVLLNAVIDINKKQHRKVIDILKRHFPSMRSKRIAILGLSFRPDTSDMRESPSIPIINELLEQGAIVRAYDPVANEEAQLIFRKGEVEFCSSLEEVLHEVDAAVLVTRWKEFEVIPHLLKGMKPQPLFVDGRRQLDKNSFSRYAGIGL
jgi:UDPglucose 6-dehydrogenase/GDP-mannose 6-dehydrogenase